jgi:serine/threonine-protein kinase RIM15
MERLLENLKCRTITVENGAEAMRYAMGEVKCMPRNCFACFKC